MCERDTDTTFLLILITILFFLLFLMVKLFRQRQISRSKYVNVTTDVLVKRKIHRSNSWLLLLLVFSVITLMFTIYLFGYSFLYKSDEEVIGWERNKSRKTLDYISPDNATTVVSPSDHRCYTNTPPELLIVVTTAVVNSERRIVIRNTWARDSQAKFNISVLFLVGLDRNAEQNNAVLLESQMYNDVIVENFIDTYNNLTLKSISMHKWAQQNCNKAKMLMKTDDDVYVNLNSLSNFIRSVPENEMDTLLVGKLYAKEKPIHYRYSKWYMPCYMYPHEYYPSFLTGPGYLMSMSVSSKLYNQSFHNDIISTEDVFLTGICAKAANIVPTDNKKFEFTNYPVSISCNSAYRSKILISQQLSPSDMYSMYSQIVVCEKQVA